MEILELFLHTDDYLTNQVESNLIWAYLILFLIIFCESAFIVCPFLPGDGLLFSAGVVAVSTDLNFYLVVPLLITAASVGFLVNYEIGAWAGIRILNKNIPIVRKYYNKTSAFIDKYGEQAVLISRFFPIVRTYLPFVAGVVQMNYKIFVRYTLLGAFVWVGFFTTAGFLLGEIPYVQENYGVIFLGLIVITLIPIAYTVIISKIKAAA